jgi:hypothetical protein
MENDSKRLSSVPGNLCALTYLKRGNTWFAKGEWERAIAEIAGSNLRTRGRFSVCMPH